MQGGGENSTKPCEGAENSKEFQKSEDQSSFDVKDSPGTSSSDSSDCEDSNQGQGEEIAIDFMGNRKRDPQKSAEEPAAKIPRYKFSVIDNL